MKRLASIMTFLAVFGWFLNPAIALCCQDCDSCTETCSVAFVPVIKEAPSCCSSKATDCHAALQVKQTSQDCCSQCRCSVTDAPTVEPMMASAVIKSYSELDNVNHSIASQSINSSSTNTQQSKLGLSPKPPGDPPGRQLLIQIQILRI
jgi:hypothetical protein